MHSNKNIGAFQLVGYPAMQQEGLSSKAVSYTKLLSGAMVSIPDFDSDDDSLNLSLTANVGFSLSGKVSHCE